MRCQCARATAKVATSRPASPLASSFFDAADPSTLSSRAPLSERRVDSGSIRRRQDQDEPRSGAPSNDEWSRQRRVEKPLASFFFFSSVVSKALRNVVCAVEENVGLVFLYFFRFFFFFAVVAHFCARVALGLGENGADAGRRASRSPGPPGTWAPGRRNRVTSSREFRLRLEPRSPGFLFHRPSKKKQNEKKASVSFSGVVIAFHFFFAGSKRNERIASSRGQVDCFFFVFFLRVPMNGRELPNPCRRTCPSAGRRSGSATAPGCRFRAPRQKCERLARGVAHVIPGA